MNIVVEIDYIVSRTEANCRAVYYSEQDETLLWRWSGVAAQIVARHPGVPMELPALRTRDGAVFAWPDDGQGIAGYREKGCACGHAFKRPGNLLRHPDAAGHAHRERVR